MKNRLIQMIPELLVLLAVCIVFAAILILLIKALKKYINSGPMRTEKANHTRSLGELLKNYRVNCKMTQEFVAETLGVSRQAVSKWENGNSDPSTSNLMALAKLYGTSAEKMIREIQGNTEE